MTKTKSSQKKLATKLSCHIFIVVKISLLVLCAFEALSYLCGNVTKSRFVTKREDE